MPDGSITFSTKLDNAQLEKDLQGAEDKVEELAQGTGKKREINFSINVSEVEKDLARLQSSIAKAETIIDKQRMGRLPIAAELEHAVSAAGQASLDLERMKKELAEAQLSIDPSSKQNRGFDLPFDKFLQYKEAVETLPAKIKEQESVYASLDKKCEQLTSKVTEYDRKIESSTQQLNEQKAKAAELAENIARAEAAQANTAVAAGKSAENLNAAADGAENAAAGTEHMSEAAKRADTFLDRFTNRIKKLAARVFVFTLITTALRNMRTWMGKAIQTNGEATAAIARLKGALLTLAQPLVEVIIPAFTMLVNILTAVIGAISKLIFILTGKSVKQTASSAKALYDEQQALEGVSAAADEAKGSLAGFDEINTIRTEDQGSSGGGASSSDIAPDFSWMDGITDRLKEIADLVMLIGLGLALWKIGQMLPGVLGQILTLLGRILMFIGGILLFWDGLADAWENGVDWFNLIEMIGGLAAAAFGLYTVLSVIAPALAPILTGVLLVAGGIAMLITAFHDAMANGWNLQNTLLAIAGIVATGLGFAFLTKSIIPAVIAAIAALLLAMTVATGHGEELLAGIRTVMEGFVDFFTGIFSGDIEKATGGIEKIFGGLGMAVGAVIDGVRDTILSFLNWLDEKTGGKLHGVIELAKSYFIDAFDTVKEFFFKNIEALKQIFIGLVQFISGVFTGDWDRAWEGVKNIFKGVWSSIASFLEAAANLIIDGVNGLIRMLNKVSFDVPDWVPAIGGKKFGFNIQPIGHISIPRLAQGAVIPPNREFLAVLGDQKSGTNVEAPLSTIEQALENVLTRNGGAGGGDIHITVELDGKVVARQTVKHINDMTRQAGKPVLLL